MKIMYVADDGKQFDTELECEDYEWSLKHKELFNIKMYDRNNNLLHDIFNEDVYYKTEVVVIENKGQLEDLKNFARYTGFTSYYDINDIGTWKFNIGVHGFIKSE